MAYYARLTWQEGNPSYKGNGFKIYVSVNGGSQQYVTSLPITTLQYDYQISPGNSYTFYVVEYKTLYIVNGNVDVESPAASVTVNFPWNPQDNKPQNLTVTIIR